MVRYRIGEERDNEVSWDENEFYRNKTHLRSEAQPRFFFRGCQHM
jgi:hypothetical protein